jgi:hypothetical protein
MLYVLESFSRVLTIEKEAEVTVKQSGQLRNVPNVAGASPGIVSCQEPWVLDNMIYQIKYIIYANWDTHIKKCKHASILCSKNVVKQGLISQTENLKTTNRLTD